MFRHPTVIVEKIYEKDLIFQMFHIGCEAWLAFEFSMS